MGQIWDKYGTIIKSIDEIIGALKKGTYCRLYVPYLFRIKGERDREIDS